jgi:hypothetical protein
MSRARCSPWNGRWSWARHNRGRHSRDKVAARAWHHRRVVARLSGIDGIPDGRKGHAHRARVDSGCGKLPTAGPVGGWSGPVVGRTLARLAGIGMPCRVVALLCRLEQSRGGKRRQREGGRKGPRFKLNFLKLSN